MLRVCDDEDMIYITRARGGREDMDMVHKTRE